MAFSVEKEEYGDVKEEQKTDPVIQIGTVNKKKIRTSKKSRIYGVAYMRRVNWTGSLS